MADRNTWQGWLPRSYDVHAGGREVDRVAEGGYGLGAVRIVGQDGTARRRAHRRDRPVVRALHILRVGGLAARELDGLSSRLVDAQNVRGDQGEIQPLGEGNVARRLEAFAEGLHLRPEISQHEDALDLAREVLVEAVTPYAG